MKKDFKKISDIIKKVLKENVDEQIIKFGTRDESGSTKIKDLQKLLNLKSSSGKSLATGYFGDITANALMRKVPDLYKGKNDTIDPTKYDSIISKLKTLPQVEPRREVPSAVKPITSINFPSLWKNFPKNSTAQQIFPIIFPTPYKMSPDSFSNACATRLSLALNNLGVKPPLQFKTEQELKYGGVNYPKGLPITVRAKDTPQYLRRTFGPPSFKGENTQENVNKYLKGKKGIFTITGVPGWSATGHADIFFDNKGQFSCGTKCYFGAGGTIQAWFVA
jgi:hypothetical protein